MFPELHGHYLKFWHTKKSIAIVVCLLHFTVALNLGTRRYYSYRVRKLYQNDAHSIKTRRVVCLLHFTDIALNLGTSRCMARTVSKYVSCTSWTLP